MKLVYNSEGEEFIKLNKLLAALDPPLFRAFVTVRDTNGSLKRTIKLLTQFETDTVLELSQYAVTCCKTIQLYSFENGQLNLNSIEHESSDTIHILKVGDYYDALIPKEGNTDMYGIILQTEEVVQNAVKLQEEIKTAQEKINSSDLDAITKDQLVEFCKTKQQTISLGLSNVDSNSHVRVACIGSMRVGKSSLINAILETEVLPTSAYNSASTVFPLDIKFEDRDDFYLSLGRISLIKFRQTLLSYLPTGSQSLTENDYANLASLDDDEDEDIDEDGDEGDSSEEEPTKESREADICITSLLTDLLGNERHYLTAKIVEAFYRNIITNRHKTSFPKLTECFELLRESATSTIYISDSSTISDTIKCIEKPALLEQAALYGRFEILRGGVVLQDVPGLQDPLEYRKEHTKAAIARSQHIWYVISDSGIAPEIETFNEIYKIVQFSSSKITIIRPKADNVVVLESKTQLNGLIVEQLLAQYWAQMLHYDIDRSFSSWTPQLNAKTLDKKKAKKKAKKEDPIPFSSEFPIIPVANPKEKTLWRGERGKSTLQVLLRAYAIPRIQSIFNLRDHVDKINRDIVGTFKAASSAVSQDEFKKIKENVTDHLDHTISEVVDSIDGDTIVHKVDVSNLNNLKAQLQGFHSSTILAIVFNSGVAVKKRFNIIDKITQELWRNCNFSALHDQLNKDFNTKVVTLLSNLAAKFEQQYVPKAVRVAQVVQVEIQQFLQETMGELRQEVAKLIQPFLEWAQAMVGTKSNTKTELRVAALVQFLDAFVVHFRELWMPERLQRLRKVLRDKLSLQRDILVNQFTTFYEPHISNFSSKAKMLQSFYKKYDKSISAIKFEQIPAILEKHKRVIVCPSQKEANFCANKYFSWHIVYDIENSDEVDLIFYIYDNDEVPQYCQSHEELRLLLTEAHIIPSLPELDFEISEDMEGVSIPMQLDAVEIKGQLFAQWEDTQVRIKKPKERDFENEVKSLSVIYHPYIANILGYDPKNKLIFLPHVIGRTMAEYISEVHTPDSTKLYWLWQLASELHYLHSRNIMHRDIKAENVIISDIGLASNKVILIDFGLARDIPDKNTSHTVAGTTCYMAPEMMNRQEYNVLPVDIYCFGLLALELMANERISDDNLTPKIPTSNSLDEFSLGVPDFLRERQSKIQNLLEKVTNNQVREIIINCLKQDPNSRIGALAVQQGLEKSISIGQINDYNREFISDYVKKYIEKENTALKIGPIGGKPKRKLRDSYRYMLLQQQLQQLVASKWTDGQRSHIRRGIENGDFCRQNEVAIQLKHDKLDQRSNNVIYFTVNQGTKEAYVGKTNSLPARTSSHKTKSSTPFDKVYEVPPWTLLFPVCQYDTELECYLLECLHILIFNTYLQKNNGGLNAAAGGPISYSYKIEEIMSQIGSLKV